MTTLLASGLSALALSLTVSATAASAASVSFERVGQGGVPASLIPAENRIVENFDGAATAGGGSATLNSDAQARTGGNVFHSDVGVFRGLGGNGSGDSQIGNSDQIQIRSGNNFGRFNVLQRGGNFLDSNDTLGFSWTITNTPTLLGAEAFITDPNDAGRQLTVSLLIDETQSFTRTLTGNPGNASIWRLLADFSTLTTEWTTATFEFRMNGNNDGIGISNAALNVIPLPAPALLLLSGLGTLGGLSALRRRRRPA